MQKSYFLFLCLLGQMTVHTLFAQESPKLTDLPAGARFYTASLRLGRSASANNGANNGFTQSTSNIYTNLGGVFYRPNNRAIYAQVYSSYQQSRQTNAAVPDPRVVYSGESGFSFGYRFHKPVLFPGLFTFIGGGPTANVSYSRFGNIAWSYSIGAWVNASAGVLYAFNENFQLIFTAASLNYDVSLSLAGGGWSQSLNTAVYPLGITLVFRPG